MEINLVIITINIIKIILNIMDKYKKINVEYQKQQKILIFNIQNKQKDLLFKYLRFDNIFNMMILKMKI